MGTASAIKAHRLRAGMSATEVAARLGLNDAWYGDLERKDSELISTLTLFQAMELGSILGVPLRDLMRGVPRGAESVSLLELPARINAYLVGNGMSVERFEDLVGWEVQDFLRSPMKVTSELPIEFLQAVTKPLGIEWLSLVPDENAE